jgi:glutamate synthase domain-containing protein 2/glutamate synthase domain-containing protein 1/glutamate synthase domain-containing protein 3
MKAVDHAQIKIAPEHRSSSEKSPSSEDYANDLTARDLAGKASTYPERHGLYDPANEHDNCGVGFVASIKGVKTHEIITQGLQILVNLDHRGAVGADPLAGDGAGILVQVPDRLLHEDCKKLGFDLPELGQYAVGMVFLPRNKDTEKRCTDYFDEFVAAEGQELLGWRDVPTNNQFLGESVKPNEPIVRQVFIGRSKDLDTVEDFERRLFVIRKQIHRAVRTSSLEGQADFYITTLSSRTIVYKGMVLAGNLPNYYTDLNDQRMESAIALVHQRFSTNTFPSWKLAQPFRYLCHNGEINTVQGNTNWMAARRHSMMSSILGDDLDKLWPLIGDGASDSATFDNALELLVAGGYSLSHAMMMMIPEAWSNNPLMDDDRRAFYEYHAALMEPWDGPAGVAFTDGKQIGATLDRNGLRPARYIVTDDDMVIMGSEVGVLPIPDEKITKKWRLQPGKMFLIDMEEGRIIDDEEIKADLATSKPYQKWLDDTQIHIQDLPNEVAPMAPPASTLLTWQQAFGYTKEDLKSFLMPMALTGQDPLGSMGTDTPLAVLSDRPKRLYDYFKQRFAQVTNPPIDPIREELVMSLISLIGPRPNLLEADEAGTKKRLEVTSPIISNLDLERIRQIENHVDNAFRTYTLYMSYPAAGGPDAMEESLEQLFVEAETVVNRGYNILILSDRNIDRDNTPIPALLATAGVHHHLIRRGLRTEVGLVVETGEAHLVHDFCMLASYGAEAINPYLALNTLTSMAPTSSEPLTEEEAHANYLNAISKGLMKVMSKMGISTYQSYCGAQVFDAVGLSETFLDLYFTGTKCAIGGIGLKEIAEESVHRHLIAYGGKLEYDDALDAGGELAYRLRGESHAWTPETVALLQHSVRSGNEPMFRRFTARVNDEEENLRNLRGLFKLKPAGDAVPLDDVEPVSAIVKRFATGAMSFGSISWEAHTTLAIAMNRIGGKSNSGEGGEEAERFGTMENGDSMRSAIKQVASGRFGVTAEYLADASDIQIKMAQGAKPGEGGQLPGYKVDEWIARVRHSTPGVGLISPPPHHDIYSIEDLAQLIHDLKNVNPQARISVKLVSEIGVGTVAAGVAKAHADHVTISGFDGGTGASPITSIQFAGSPWEIGLAETHQTLVMNNLRGRISVQVDGGLRTGRDVVVGALLGADEFGFATAALISSGCIMMRKCHLNTCPVGVATQDPELRKLYKGQPEHVINFFTFIANEVRELMAELGFRTVGEMIGQRECLEVAPAVNHWKAQGVDLTNVLAPVEAGDGVAISNTQSQKHGLEKALDNHLIEKSQGALASGKKVEIELGIKNVNRTVGAMLSGRIAKTYGHKGLPEDTIKVHFEGSAGQSFGAFLARGVSFDLEGDANDYVGKGLSGGRIAIYPPKVSTFLPGENIIVGNTVLYGAIDGECYFRGVAGERFAVRNSGVKAVVEGVGDHGCEYMTGGVVVVLGATGRNFAAGMSGGMAYVLDEDGTFEMRCNTAMVELGPVEDEPIAANVDIDGDLLAHDAARLRQLLVNHMNYAGSTRAKEILDKWETYLPKFVKVMPVDYRRALMDMAKAKAQDAVGDEKSEPALAAGE